MTLWRQKRRIKKWSGRMNDERRQKKFPQFSKGGIPSRDSAGRSLTHFLHGSWPRTPWAGARWSRRTNKAQAWVCLKSQTNRQLSSVDWKSWSNCSLGGDTRLRQPSLQSPDSFRIEVPCGSNTMGAFSFLNSSSHFLSFSYIVPLS